MELRDAASYPRESTSISDGEELLPFQATFDASHDFGNDSFDWDGSFSLEPCCVPDIFPLQLASSTVFDDIGMRSSASLASAQAETGRKQKKETYADLIYKALISQDAHQMTLKDLYQWFIDNTEKPKERQRGWKNSVRSNLSLNQVSSYVCSLLGLPPESFSVFLPFRFSETRKKTETKSDSACVRP